MSFGIHTLGFLSIALLFNEQPPRSILERSDRRAEIVLVPAPIRADAAESEAGTASAQSDEASNAAASATAADSAVNSLVGQGSALPSGFNPPEVPGMQLPQFSGIQPSGNGGVVSIGSLGSGGRPIVLPTAHEAEILAEEAARPKQPLPQGKPAQLSVFGTAAIARSFVFVIDRSESMGSNRLGAIDAAARELSVSIDSLTPDQYFQVVAYNQAASVYARRELMPATDANKAELLQFARKITSAGGTEHNFGLQAALRLHPEVIYLFTDGGDPIPNALQRRTVRDLAGGRTQIHCVHFGRGSEPQSGVEFLKRVAAENSGQYAYIDLNRR